MNHIKQIAFSKFKEVKIKKARMERASVVKA
jgi:hypothetical protein